MFVDSMFATKVHRLGVFIRKSCSIKIRGCCKINNRSQFAPFHTYTSKTSHRTTLDTYAFGARGKIITRVIDLRADVIVLLMCWLDYATREDSSSEMLKFSCSFAYNFDKGTFQQGQILFQRIIVKERDCLAQFCCSRVSFTSARINYSADGEK